MYLPPDSLTTVEQTTFRLCVGECDFDRFEHSRFEVELALPWVETEAHRPYVFFQKSEPPNVSVHGFVRKQEIHVPSMNMVSAWHRICKVLSLANPRIRFVDPSLMISRARKFRHLKMGKKAGKKALIKVEKGMK